MILRPVTAGGAGQSRLRRPLLGDKNGVNKEFTTDTPFLATVSGYEPWVYLNGALMDEGSEHDYELGESGGAGTGYDKVTFTEVTPITKDKLSIILIPAS